MDHENQFRTRAGWPAHDCCEPTPHRGAFGSRSRQRIVEMAEPTLLSKAMSPTG